MTYRMAPMSAPILVLTLGLLALPPVFAVLAMRGAELLAIPALLLIVLYAWVWLWFRPTAFVVGPGAVEVGWPLRSREIPRREISAVRLIDRATLRREGFATSRSPRSAGWPPSTSRSPGAGSRPSG